jgi:hypothetical protein
MGRPNKLNVSAANSENVAEVVARTLKKVRAFTREELTALVVGAYKAEENVSTNILESTVVAQLGDLVAASKVTNDNGNYKVVVGKRGRPKKVVAETAVAAQ